MFFPIFNLVVSSSFLFFLLFLFFLFLLLHLLSSLFIVAASFGYRVTWRSSWTWSPSFSNWTWSLSFSRCRRPWNAAPPASTSWCWGCRSELSHLMSSMPGGWTQGFVDRWGSAKYSITWAPKLSFTFKQSVRKHWEKFSLTFRILSIIFRKEKPPFT